MSDQKGTGAQGDGKQADRDNHANQLNPEHPEYKGGSSKYPGAGTKADLDNHSNQKNPNHSEYGGGSKPK